MAESNQVAYPPNQEGLFIHALKFKGFNDSCGQIIPIKDEPGYFLAVIQSTVPVQVCAVQLEGEEIKVIHRPNSPRQTATPTLEGDGGAIPSSQSIGDEVGGSSS